MKGKKIVLASGGTGGHIFPAQGLAQQLLRRNEGHDVLFIAGGLAANRYFDRSIFPFQEVSCSSLLATNPLKSLKGMGSILRGIYQSINFLRKYRPDVVVGFGSYYSIPPLVAAKILNIPIVLHEANSIPGKVNKWFAPYVKAVGVHFPFTLSLLKGNAYEVGMPLRETYTRSHISKEKSRLFFDLEPHRKTLLIFGDSQGATAINYLIQELVLQKWEKHLQIIHLSGDTHIVNEMKEFYFKNGIKGCIKAFEQQMNMAWSAADIFIGRAGASTIAEAMEFEVPGILIPYPNATDNHQEKNADFFVETVGGGIKLLEKNLSVTVLKDRLEYLLIKENLQRFHLSLYSYKRRPKRKDLCEIVLESL